MIVCENGKYYILRVKTGYEIYKNGPTHATRCAIIGYKGNNGFNKALIEIDRRVKLDGELIVRNY